MSLHGCRPARGRVGADTALPSRAAAAALSRKEQEASATRARVRSTEPSILGPGKRPRPRGLGLDESTPPLKDSQASNSGYEGSFPAAGRGAGQSGSRSPFWGSSLQRPHRETTPPAHLGAGTAQDQAPPGQWCRDRPLSHLDIDARHDGDTGDAGDKVEHVRASFVLSEPPEPLVWVVTLGRESERVAIDGGP